MNRQTLAVVLGSLLFLVCLPLGGFALAQTDEAMDPSTDEGITAIPNAPSEDYGKLQKDLQQDRLTDAFKRIQAIEQENRFQARRIEKLERDVNDLRNDSSSRVSV